MKQVAPSSYDSQRLRSSGVSPDIIPMLSVSRRGGELSSRPNNVYFLRFAPFVNFSIFLVSGKKILKIFFSNQSPIKIFYLNMPVASILSSFSLKNNLLNVNGLTRVQFQLVNFSVLVFGRLPV